MNCCNHNNQNNNNNGGHKHGAIGFLWMIVMCCGAPIILIAIISILGPSFSGLRSVAPFLCPIMMVIMIPMMLRKDKNNSNGNSCCENKDQQITNETTEETKLLK